MLDPEGPEPVYRQLANLIRERIDSGELPPDRPIPSVARMVQEHSVARGTALHALRLLVDEGRVVIVKGRGAYVVRRDGAR
jgi:DNA-binding GntR family transcriptional regulator